MVKRYDIGVEYQASCPVAEAFEAEDGYYVLFTDYEYLGRERDGLRGLLKTADCPNNCFVKGSHYNNIGNINQCKFCSEYRKLLAKGADHER